MMAALAPADGEAKFTPSLLAEAFHAVQAKVVRWNILDHGTRIDAPIGRHPGADYKFAVTADGRPSVTHYETLEAFRAASLLFIRLETGRTHQIRVHMAAIRHPCVGDLTYGADPTLAARLGLHRQWLHAAQLSFAHPTEGRPVTFDSPDPPDLAAALEILEAES